MKMIHSPSVAATPFPQLVWRVLQVVGGPLVNESCSDANRVRLAYVFYSPQEILRFHLS